MSTKNAAKSKNTKKSESTDGAKSTKKSPNPTKSAKPEKSTKLAPVGLYLAAGAVLLIAIIVTLVYATNNSTTTPKEDTVSTSTVNVKVTKSAIASVQYEKFDNGLVSLDIPKGWKVSVASADYIHYTFMAYNPENPSYRIFFNMKSEGYLKTKAMRDLYKSTYPNSEMATLPYIDPQTTEAFYQIFTEAFSAENTSSFTFPVIKNFKQIEKIGTNITGGDIIRATYKDGSGKTVDGIFSATIKEVSLYYVTALNVYTTIFYTAPENELTEWESILNHCVGTIEFSSNFVSGFNGQEQIIASGLRANQQIYNEMTNIITKGWEARQSTYDIISQKQSDATLGYERVYNVDTGDIYKAYNGFTDDYSGNKYKPVTDSMYNLPTSGYIEK